MEKEPTCIFPGVAGSTVLVNNMFRQLVTGNWRRNNSNEKIYDECRFSVTLRTFYFMLPHEFPLLSWIDIVKGQCVIGNRVVCLILTQIAYYLRLYETFLFISYPAKKYLSVAFRILVVTQKKLHLSSIFSRAG